MNAMTVEEFESTYGRGVSPLEARMALLLRAMDQEHRLPEVVREYSFHTQRKWRFDFAFPEQKVAIEVEGGTWSGGRHTRGAGFRGDCEKYNAAVLLGWRVLRFTAGMIEDAQATMDTIGRALGLDRKES